MAGSDSVEERNARFFERHDVALAQERALNEAMNTTTFIFIGEKTEDAVLSVSRKEVGGHGRRAELVLSTAGHEWFLLEDWTDSLYKYLGTVIEARNSAKKARAESVFASAECRRSRMLRPRDVDGC